MPDAGYLRKLANGVPVTAAPAEIDITTANQLCAVFLEAASYGQATVAVDMSRTRFCESAGLSISARAHQRALAEGGEVRLVIPADGGDSRALNLTYIDPVHLLLRQPGRGPCPEMPACRPGNS